MAYKVKQDVCTNCGACDDACPAGAIVEKNGKRWVEADNCVDCGACEGECPAGAIHAG